MTFQGFFEGIRATRGGAGGPGAPRPAVGAGALAMDTMDDDDAAGGVSLYSKVARWQNLIPSCVGAQPKERKGSNFAA